MSLSGSFDCLRFVAHKHETLAPGNVTAQTIVRARLALFSSRSSFVSIIFVAARLSCPFRIARFIRFACTAGERNRLVACRSHDVIEPNRDEKINKLFPSERRNGGERERERNVASHSIRDCRDSFIRCERRGRSFRCHVCHVCEPDSRLCFSLAVALSLGSTFSFVAVPIDRSVKAFVLPTSSVSSVSASPSQDEKY